MENVDIKLLHTPLQPNFCLDFVQAPDCGGVNLFIGSVRNNTAGKQVIRLDFEAYEPMASSELDKIAQRMLEKWPLKKISLHHRLGQLEIGELAVVIAVSAAHRDAAFKACRFAIDTLKETVPIWKKEIFEDGEVWVAAHP